MPYIGLSGGAGAQYSYWGGGGGGVMVNGEGPEKSYYGRGQVRALNFRIFCISHICPYWYTKALFRPVILFHRSGSIWSLKEGPLDQWQKWKNNPFFLYRATEREEQTTITSVRGTLVPHSYSLEVVLCRAMIVLILAKDLLELLKNFFLQEWKFDSLIFTNALHLFFR